MKIFKYLAMLLLAFTLSPVLCGAETADGKNGTAEEPGFFAKLFGAEKEEVPLARPEPWDKKLVYNTEEAAKVEEEPCWAEVAAKAVGTYLANVGCDFLDIMSMEVSFGNTFALDLHLTQYCDFGLENSDAYFAGFGPLNRIGAGRRQAQRMAALCWSYDDIYISQTAGNIPSFTLEDTSFNLVLNYTTAFVDRDIDPYALGSRVAMIVGFAFDLHWMAIPDFFCSIVGVDISGDNWK